MPKKRFLGFAVIIFILFINLFCSCAKSEFSLPISKGEFSVHFINVGQGDGALICFDDGKTMLIDCGTDNEDTAKLITTALQDYNGGTLDYLVLTHPDIDHVGNAYRIAQTLSVKKAFIPDVKNKSLFHSFEKAVTALEKQGTVFEISDVYDYVQGDNYFLAFIYPRLVRDNVYDRVNSIEYPTDEQVNDLSPVIYLRYKNVKFLFTGDADNDAESDIIDLHTIGFYNNLYTEERVNIDGIDFLKVAHHGSSNSSSMEFLELLKPKNAIISVGGANMYGHPATQTLKRLVAVNEDIKVLRTDVYGTISVKINSSGTVKIVTEAD